MTENEISFKIRGAIFKVYDELGPGLLESIYEAALCYQMKKDGLIDFNGDNFTILQKLWIVGIL